MKRAPIGHFLPVDLPAIVLHCQLTTLQSALYVAVRDKMADRATRAEYRALTAQLTSVNRLLRIGPSTRTTQRDRAGRNARDHADAFDPNGAGWQEIMKHGRGGHA